MAEEEEEEEKVKKKKKKQKKKKKNTVVKKTFNKAIKMLYWKRQLLQAVKGNSSPTIERIKGATYISINENHRQRKAEVKHLLSCYIVESRLFREV